MSDPIGAPTGSAYPRELAVRIITRVLSEGRTLESALEEAFATGNSGGKLQPQARAWLQEICSGTLRWKGRLDLAIDSTALKKKPSGWLRKMLLISAYQLIAQDRTQPAAVVNETVEAVRRMEGEAPAKFANAMLRKIGEHSQSWKEIPLPKPGSPDSDFAAWACLPEWFWRKLKFARGEEWAIAYSRAALERPKGWVRARNADWTPQWASRGPIPLSWEISEKGAIPEKTGFHEGEFISQDISSQILVREIDEEIRKRLGGSGSVGSRAELTALDLCAAPGGKAIGLAWSGWFVTATDRESIRIDLLKQTVLRVGQGSRIDVIERAATASLAPQDLVWVDAPCTGSGIIRRHPDVRWLREEREVALLNQLQLELVREAWSKVRPGGFLAYSVCSVFPDEGPRLIKSAALPGAVAPLREWLLEPQTAPFGDGFWATLIQKS